MSQTRQPAAVVRRRLTAEQEPFLVARALSTTYSGGSCLHPHRHASHQLLFASTGAMTVTGDRTSWMIPPGRAVLIPAGVPHAIRMWGDVAMRSLYFPVEVAVPVADPATCRVISVTPLLREIILRVADLAALDSRVEAEARLMSVLMDELAAAPIEPLLLPLPSDPRALTAANAVLADPAEEATTDDLARRSGLSARTLERLFRAETGMSFGVWRQKARLLESVRLLAERGLVTDAALDSGYSSVSAYIAAFKQTFGCTPGAMLAERPES
ncbi:MAG TPA: helix-turn-helix transcriptional regulator [Vicinamibacterales bacterium]|jgi:AraC-like DNA-binding protein/quercetin dioxygenase-like cupin family protein|nr:helix-turn-helix transcriptional regulator [Vicinamibacterales bacterium]